MTFRFSTYAKGLKPYNVLFFGSDEFSTICLQTMLQRSNMIRNVEVVLPYHMNQPLRTFAISNYLEIHRAPAHGESWKNWKVPEFDIGVVVSFVILILIIGYILNIFKVGTLNVHPSLLPKYRGSSPIQYTLLNRDKIGGISIIELSPHKFDAGRILKQETLTIQPTIKYPQLLNEMAVLGGKNLSQVIDDFPNYQKNSVFQDETQVTLAPKITGDQAMINWNHDKAEEIFAKYRAFYSKIPIYSYIGKKKVLLIEVENPDTNPKLIENLPPQNYRAGSMLFDSEKNCIYIKCMDGWLPVKKFRVQDKRDCDAKDFRNGYFSQYNLLGI